MADNSRIDNLRRRVREDPTSLTFAQLAEECRRAGRYKDAIDACRAGLVHHPEYVSARVTLGRALLASGDAVHARETLRQATTAAPENLAAHRALAEAHHQLDELVEARGAYGRALELARADAAIERTIADIDAALKARGLTAPSAAPPPPVKVRTVPTPPAHTPLPVQARTAPAPPAHTPPPLAPAPRAIDSETHAPFESFEVERHFEHGDLVVVPMPPAAVEPPPPAPTPASPVLIELEQWLLAIATERSRRQTA